MKDFLLSIGKSILSTLVIGCVGCGVKRPVEHPALTVPIPESVIIFIPGYKGTILADENERVVWVSAATALTNTHSLVVDDGTLGFEKVEKLHAAATLDSVRVIPHIYSLHFYDRWVTFLTRIAGKSQVIPLVYDWRRDNVETVRQLSTLVHSLRTAGVKRVYLVSHSMGSMVTAYFLRYGIQAPENATENWEGASQIDGAVMMGCPFRGATTMLRDMQQGVTTGVNTTLLDSDAVASFPSSYQLLPLPGETGLVDGNFVPLNHNWFDVDFWRQNSLGILGSANESNRQARENYIKKNLAYAKKWFERINTPSDHPGAPTPVLNLVGAGFTTLTRLVFLGGRNIIGDVEALEESVRARGVHELFADGDGTVSVESATLPSAYRGLKAENYEVAGEHGSILLYPETQQRVIEFLSSLDVTKEN